MEPHEPDRPFPAAMSDPFRATREKFQAIGLDRAALDPDPFVQFRRWFDEAVAAGIHEPDAFVVATADENGRPSARHVLLKGLDSGFVFFTNYTSRKADELEANPFAAICFPWNILSRQVRVNGTVERVSEAESDEYFSTRARESQLGAWASHQSAVLDDRAQLEERYREADARFVGTEVERPPHWGGYRIVPDEIEFWQGRPNRLHDRFRYRRSADGGWLIERLSP